MLVRSPLLARSTLAVWLLLILGALSLSSCMASSKARWHHASQTDTIAAYEEFLSGGRTYGYRDQALVRLGELRYEAIEDSPTIAELEEYLEKHSDSRYASQATETLAGLLWSDLAQAPTVVGCETFVDRFPNYSRIGEVLTVYEELHWRQADGSGNYHELLSYIESFPEGVHLREALAQGDAVAVEALSAESRPEAYETYLASFPSGSHRERMLADLRSAMWSATQRNEHDAAPFHAFLDRFPEGEHADAARDYVAYHEAELAGTGEALDTYLDAYPNGRFAERADALATALLIPAGPETMEAINAILKHQMENSMKNGFGGMRGSIKGSLRVSGGGGEFSGGITYEGTIDPSGMGTFRYEAMEGAICRPGGVGYVRRGSDWYPEIERWFR